MGMLFLIQADVTEIHYGGVRKEKSVTRLVKASDHDSAERKLIDHYKLLDNDPYITHRVWVQDISGVIE